MGAGPRRRAQGFPFVSNPRGRKPGFPNGGGKENAGTPPIIVSETVRGVPRGRPGSRAGGRDGQTDRRADGETDSETDRRPGGQVDLFFVPWKMALFPDGFDAKPARPPDPCTTRLPDPPTAKLEVHHRLKMIFG